MNTQKTERHYAAAMKALEKLIRQESIAGSKLRRIAGNMIEDGEELSSDCVIAVTNADSSLDVTAYRNLMRAREFKRGDLS